METKSFYFFYLAKSGHVHAKKNIVVNLRSVTTSFEVCVKQSLQQFFKFMQDHYSTHCEIEKRCGSEIYIDNILLHTGFISFVLGSCFSLILDTHYSYRNFHLENLYSASSGASVDLMLHSV